MQKRCMADFLNIFRVEGMIDTNSVERTKRLMLVGAVYLTCAFFFVNSFALKQDAGLFPRYLSILLGLLNTLYLADVLRNKDVPKKKKEEIVRSRLLGAVLLAVVYVATLNILGVLAASLICIPVMMVILGVRNKLVIVLMSVIAVAVLWLFFGVFLHVPLSEGIFQF